jgi:polyhydroxyalkanoate synthesis regulator phasin
MRTVEEEMSRRFQSLRDRTDLHQQSEEVQRVLSDLGRRLQQSSESLEHRIEENVKNVLGRFRVPLMEEIAQLNTRVEDLSRRVEQQIRRREAEQVDAGQQGAPAPEPRATSDSAQERTPDPELASEEDNSSR